MRFGNLRFDGVIKSNTSGDRLVNIGDSAELLAIDKLYQAMGITAVECIGACCYEIKDYTGDYIVVPINVLVYPDGIGSDLLNLPERVIPVYLGLAFANLNVSQQQLQYLKRFEPIGCRDERTMHFLRSKGIAAYVFGCIVGTYPKTTTPIAERNTVFFIDVPKSILPFVPVELFENIEFMNHEFYESRGTWGDNSGKECAEQTIHQYAKNAKLIVTSRFHAAVLGLALGIPTIVVLENSSFKWSWVSKFLTVYTPENFSQINWTCSSVNFEPIKAMMLTVAKKRIRETYEKYTDIYSLSYLHENDLRSDEANLLYYSAALNEIEQLWKRTPEKCYIIWGTAQNAEKIYSYVLHNYPDVKLTAVYDYYTHGRTFHGLRTVSPSEDICLRDKDIFTIVTSHSAKDMAKQLFHKIGKQKDKFVLCTLEFLVSDDLNSQINQRRT